jgi:hypothetical protein
MPNFVPLDEGAHAFELHYIILEPMHCQMREKKEKKSSIINNEYTTAKNLVPASHLASTEVLVFLSPSVEFFKNMCSLLEVSPLQLSNASPFCDAEQTPTSFEETACTVR